MRRLLHALSLPVLLVLVGGLAACGDDDGADTSTGPGGAGEVTRDDLAGREFVSTQVTGHELVAESQILLGFDDTDGGRLSASAGCNGLSGAYAVEGDVLRLDGAIKTMMRCDDALMDQDDWLFELLSASPTLSLDGDELTLTSDDVEVEFIDLDVAVPTAPVVGTRWQLHSIIDGLVATSAPIGVDAPTLEIAEDGSVTLFAGCNSGVGSVEVGESTMTFGPIGLTRMMCEPAAMEVEQSVVAVLDGEVNYEVQRDQLSVQRGEHSLVFAAS